MRLCHTSLFFFYALHTVTSFTVRRKIKYQCFRYRRQYYFVKQQASVFNKMIFFVLAVYAFLMQLEKKNPRDQWLTLVNDVIFSTSISKIIGIVSIRNTGTECWHFHSNDSVYIGLLKQQQCFFLIPRGMAWYSFFIMEVKYTLVVMSLPTICLETPPPFWKYHINFNCHGVKWGDNDGPQ